MQMTLYLLGDRERNLPGSRDNVVKQSRKKKLTINCKTEYIVIRKTKNSRFELQIEEDTIESIWQGL